MSSTPDHHAIALKWLESWRAPLNALSVEEFTSFYTPNVQWYDHGFLLYCNGRSGVALLRQRWLSAHEPYRIDLEEIHTTPTGAILQVVNVGTFKNDTLSPKRKANGKSFEAQACYVLRIAKDGLIEKVDEYQSVMFDEGVSVDKYTLRE
jgi:hypothetical protein